MSDQLEQGFDQGRVVLEVPKLHVKTVKSALETAGQLDRTSRITMSMSQDTIASTPGATEQNYEDDQGETDSDSLQSSIATPVPVASPGGPEPSTRFPVLKFDVTSGQYVDTAALRKGNPSTGAVEEQRMRIPTTIPYSLSADVADDISKGHYNHGLKSRILEGLDLSHLFQDISISHQPAQNSSTAPSSHNPLHKALKEALDTLSQPILAALFLTTEDLVSSFPRSYSVYKPMLLLPHNTFASKAWTTLLSAHAPDSVILLPVWQRMAEAVGMTHVALNSPIPLQASTETAADPQYVESSAQENTLRSPVNLIPIYGDFGPSPTPQTLSSPTKADFENALWVTATQNDIHQTWAPRYTMFSRGNIREKTRLINASFVTMDFGVPSAAVDLYAGIGYFAFCYKRGGACKANGIKKLLCWELNPWSVEGLRRGVEMNGWTCKIWSKKEIPDSDVGWESWRKEVEKQEKGEGKSEDFWIFGMNNDIAACLIQHLKAPDTPLIPPIRHVNLGLLPSSALSWRTAAQTLDFRCGGWIHVHENVGVTSIEMRSREIENEFQVLWNEREEDGCGKRLGKSRGRSVKVEHVERIKMYAPGVVHCVFDVYIHELS